MAAYCLFVRSAQHAGQFPHSRRKVQPKLSMSGLKYGRHRHRSADNDNGSDVQHAIANAASCMADLASAAGCAMGCGTRASSRAVPSAPTDAPARSGNGSAVANASWTSFRPSRAACIGQPIVASKLWRRPRIISGRRRSLRALDAPRDATNQGDGTSDSSFSLCGWQPSRTLKWPGLGSVCVDFYRGFLALSYPLRRASTGLSVAGCQKVVLFSD